VLGTQFLILLMTCLTAAHVPRQSAASAGVVAQVREDHSTPEPRHEYDNEGTAGMLSAALPYAIITAALHRVVTSRGMGCMELSSLGVLPEGHSDQTGPAPAHTATCVACATCRLHNLIMPHSTHADWMVRIHSPFNPRCLDGSAAPLPPSPTAVTLGNDIC
jgi:hypothetical protein